MGVRCQCYAHRYLHCLLGKEDRPELRCPKTLLLGVSWGSSKAFREDSPGPSFLPLPHLPPWLWLLDEADVLLTHLFRASSAVTQKEAANCPPGHSQHLTPHPGGLRHAGQPRALQKACGSGRGEVGRAPQCRAHTQPRTPTETAGPPPWPRTSSPR